MKNCFFFVFFFDLLTFYQRRSKVNDTKTLKVVYQANQKEKLLGKLGSLIVSLNISYKNSSTFRCNLGFVNKFCKLKSTPWVLHAFCNFLCAFDKLEQRKIMCSTVSFSLLQNLHAGESHLPYSKRRLLNRPRPTATEWYHEHVNLDFISLCQRNGFQVG